MEKNKIITACIILSSLSGCMAVDKPQATIETTKPVISNNNVEDEFSRSLSSIKSAGVDNYHYQYHQNIDTLREMYPGAYLSKSQAYTLPENKFLIISPWFSTPVKYTVFPVAEKTIYSFPSADKIKTLDLNQIDVLNMLKKENYKIKIVSKPVLHYVLELTPSEIDSYEFFITGEMLLLSLKNN